MNRKATGRIKRSAFLLVAGLIAVLIVSGCAAELPDDGPAPATSAASAMRFAEKAVAATRVAANTGRFELTVTETEVTSFLSIRALLLRQTQALPLGDLDQIQDIPELEGVDLRQWQELLEQREGLPGLEGRRLRLRLSIDDPVVRFRGNGEMLVRGSIRFLILELPVRIVTAPRAAEGELVLDFVEGQVGALPMPEVLFDALGQGLSSAILLGEEYVRISEISVRSGTLTVRGQYER